MLELLCKLSLAEIAQSKLVNIGVQSSYVEVNHHELSGASIVRFNLCNMWPELTSLFLFYKLNCYLMNQSQFV